MHNEMDRATTLFSTKFRGEEGLIREECFCLVDAVDALPFGGGSALESYLSLVGLGGKSIHPS